MVILYYIFGYLPFLICDGLLVTHSFNYQFLILLIFITIDVALLQWNWSLIQAPCLSFDSLFNRNWLSHWFLSWVQETSNVCIALSFGSTVLNILGNVVPLYNTYKMGRLIVVVNALLSVSNILSSVIPTFIICRHIYLNTQGNKRSRRRYRHIIDILIRSSALYTFFATLRVIACFLNTTDQAEGHINAVIFLLYAENMPSIAGVSKLHLYG